VVLNGLLDAVKKDHNASNKAHSSIYLDDGGKEKNAKNTSTSHPSMKEKQPQEPHT
jgi:hypothetical protein